MDKEFETVIYFKGKFTINQNDLSEESALIDTQCEFINALHNLPDYMEITEWDDAIVGTQNKSNQGKSSLKME